MGHTQKCVFAPEGVRDMKIHTFVYGCDGEIGLTLQSKERIMNQKDMGNISKTRILISGKGALADRIESELRKVECVEWSVERGEERGEARTEAQRSLRSPLLPLRYNYIVETSDTLQHQLTTLTSSLSTHPPCRLVLPFDFIDGGCVVIVNKPEELSVATGESLRTHIAEYVAGYSAFWNLTEYGWLRELLPSIKAGEKSDKGMAIAAEMCAKVFVNLAAGREVKAYPRFYLYKPVESGEMRVESERWKVGW